MEILYKNTPLSLQSGDVILYHNEWIWNKPITYLSWTIRKLTNSYWNHAACVVSNGYSLEINEALGKGVVGRSLRKYLERPKSYIKILRPKAMQSEEWYCMRANEAKGSAYDFKNLIVKHVWYMITGNWKRKSEEKEVLRMVCSEYVAWTHQLPEWWLMTAKDLERCGAFEIVYSE